MRSVYRIGELAEQVTLSPRQELVEDPPAVVRAEELDGADLTGTGHR
ncbi:hypothetical protein [Micromonospora kangleipakensis]|nr:hypothetical protein [Micromonospora kangleipakensis]